ncbi:MAG: hypothetical protein IPG51_19305 [Chloroflexi bacterium]|nr:hypothetical protein [Chloroflexota bacterium]
MAKYTFFQGQVFVDESAYAPILKKPKQMTEISVLLMVRETAPNPNQENRNHDKQESESE